MLSVTSIEQPGQVEGARRMLIWVLEARFQTLPESLVERVSALTLSQANATAPHVVAALTLEDFIRELPPENPDTK